MTNDVFYFEGEVLSTFDKQFLINKEKKKNGKQTRSPNIHQFVQHTRNK